MRRHLYGHGLGRHTTAEIQAMAVADIDALADFLGTKPYFLGERPTSLDAAAYAHLANLLAPPIDSPARRRALDRSNLVAYCERMKAAYYAAGSA
jgi:glutathione S-transferase